MMERVITAIKVQKRNPQRVNIDLDGEFAFGLSRLVAAWLKPGDQLSEEKINSLIEKDALEVAYQRALDLFSHRPRSEKEVRQRLTEKAFQPDQIDQVVEKLKQANLVRDESFARMWVESRNEFHPRGRRLLRYELRTKGITESHIDSALEEIPGEEELALKAAVQYARRLTGLDWQTFRNRLSGFLARRGFTYAVFAPIVRSLWESQVNAALNSTNIDNEEFEK
jgi:regulatory protein